MSADDFQTKYASVMESMLKSAIAETTKLFETMVDDLKAEISRIKKENEDLKTRCSQFENWRIQSTVYTGESEPVHRPSDSSGKRDTAVQCDLVPFRTMLVEQCQPLSNSSLQNQQPQCSYEEMEYGVQEHNNETHEEGNSQMAFILVKQEECCDDSSLQSVWKPEDVEPTVVCGQVSNAGSPQATACGTENEGPVNQERSTGEGVISLSEQSDVTLQQYTDLHCTEERPVEARPQNKKVAHEELKSVTAEGEASSQPLRRRRGRPPKKAKYVKVKEILELPSTGVTTAQEVVTSPTVRVEEVEVSSAVNTVNTVTASESPQAFPVEPKKTSPIITPSVQERANTSFGHVENGMVGSLPVPGASQKEGCSSEKEKKSVSPQLSMEIEASSTDTETSATEILNSPAAESPQTSVELRTRHTSVTLQDAMLLVEAMNRPTEKNTYASPERMAAAVQTQCAPYVGTLQTVDKVPAELQTPPLPTETLAAAGSLSITELSTTQTTIKTNGSRPHVTRSTTTSDGQTYIKVVIPERQDAVTPCNATPPIPSSTAATQTISWSQQHLPHPLKTSGAPSKSSNTVLHKIIVVPRSLPSLMHHKIAAFSPTQFSSFVSTVVAARNKSILPASTAASLPPRTSSFSSVPQKTTYVTSTKSLPVVPSLSTATSTEQQSRILPLPNITIISPRQVSAVESSIHQSQTVVHTTKQESAEPVAAVAVSSSQLISSSQVVTVSEDTQTALDEVATISSEKRHHAADNLESPKQICSVSETTIAPSETCSSLMSVPTDLLPASVSPVEQKLSAVVRLTRLPFSVSTKESVLVSRVFSKGSSETQSILKEGTTQEKPPFVVISSQAALSTDLCASLKETSLSVNTSQMSEEQNNIQEIALLPSDTCTIVGDSYVGVVQPSAPPKQSASVLEKSAVGVSTIELSVGETPSNLEKEITNFVQDCALRNGPPTEEQQSAALLQLIPIRSKDTSDPHLQMTKTQFLAQLAVSPTVQAPKTTSSIDFEDTRTSTAETLTSGKKRLQTTSLVAGLRSHLKMHLQTRKTETNPDPCTERETSTVSPKKLRLDVYPNDKNPNSDPIPISPKKPVLLEDVTSLDKTTNDSTPNGPRRSGLYKDAFRPKRSVSEPTRSSEVTGESTRVSPRTFSSGRNSVGSKNMKCTSVTPPRSGSIKDVASAKKTKNGVSPKNTKSPSVIPKRSSSTRESARIKKSEFPAVSPGTSSSSESGKSLKMSTSELSVNHRSTFRQDSCGTKQIKRKPCPRRTTGNAIAETKIETGSPSVRWLKLASPGNAGESTSARKARLIQDGSGPKKNLRVLNAKKLAKAAKVKTIAKMKNSNQSKVQNGAKTNQLPENQARTEVVKRYKAKAVWIPPRMPASKILSAGGKRSSLLPVKQETRSPRSQNHTVVYPPSISLHPIPVKAPPVVSPLQPLSVIGGRLLKNQCGECGRILSSSAALESHVSLHTGRRPFSCTLCGKSFPDSKGLKRHGRVHRNGRIHICQQCRKGFVYHFGLTKHLQMVHARIKPFVCQICNKGFFTKRDVEAHIRIHTGEKPFHCNLCDKKFTRRVELNVHLRWHNGEKRHWCPYCGKGFLDFNNLKRHKYIHTGEKPHSCPHCPKHFTQSGHLKKHVKNVHKVQ